MSLVDEIQSVAAKALPYVDFFVVVEKAVGIGGLPAETATAVIRAAVAAVASGADVKRSAEQALAEIQGEKASLLAGEAADDEASDSVLAERRVTESFR
jgi:hypothetical protein